MYPPLTPSITATTRPDGSVQLEGAARGGDGHRLAWRWRFADGETAEGPTVTHSFADGVTPGATLTVADGTTMTASADWPTAP